MGFRWREGTRVAFAERERATAKTERGLLTRIVVERGLSKKTKSRENGDRERLRIGGGNESSVV